VQEELEPVDKAKSRAELRFKRRKSDISLLFSDEPPLIEAIGTSIDVSLDFLLPIGNA
jgi:hypothetical protein